MLTITRTILAASTFALLLPDGPMPTRLVGDSLPPAAWAPQDAADATYRRAREALMKGEYRAAAGLFKQIGERWPRSTYVPDALYWRAVSLSRVGSVDALHEAQAVLQEHERRFANARTAGEARTLATRIKGELAQRGDSKAAGEITDAARRVATTSCPRDDDDSDMRIAALNALHQMDASRALPILRDVMKKQDRCSESLRRKAVFLISQKDSPEAGDLLLATVRTDPSESVREQAVHWLGQIKGERITAALEEIALRSPDVELRKKAVFALTQQGTARASAVIRQLAEREDTPLAVREQAVFWLGQDGSTANAQFLRALFDRVARAGGSADMRNKILFSLSQMQGQGNDRWLMGIASDAAQPIEIRKHALFSAGQAGVAIGEVVALYGRVTDRAMKQQVLFVLSQRDERAAADKLFEIARRDPDIEIRKNALFWLGQKDDPRVQQLLLDIINGRAP